MTAADTILEQPNWQDRRARLLNRLDEAGWDQSTHVRWDSPTGNARIRIPLDPDTIGADRLLDKAEREWRTWVIGERAEIHATLRDRIASGEKFTADEIWDTWPDKIPAIHRNWLGGVMMRLCETKQIRFRGHIERPRASRHSRVVKVWVGTAAGREKLAA